jgi:hypothetical protein
MKRGPIVAIILLPLAACGGGSSTAASDWRNTTVHAKVGEVVFELKPGPTYSLGSLTDKAINSAIAGGWGTSMSPLEVPHIRVGVHSADRRGLEYDVGVVDSTDHLGAKGAVNMPNELSALKSISFAFDMSSLSNASMDNEVILSFENGRTQTVPVTCRAQHLDGARPITTCSDLRLIYRDNYVYVNSRSGDHTDDILGNFEDGLTIVSEMER